MTNAEMYHAETAAWLENKRREFEDRKTRLAFYDVQLTLAAQDVERSVTPATVESPGGYRIILDPPAKTWLADQESFDAFAQGRVI